MTATNTQSLGVAELAEGARGLVAATLSWTVRETSTALAALATAATIFVALSALRRLAAPRAIDAPGAAGRRSIAGIVRRALSHTKDWFLLALGLRVAGAWFALPRLLADGVELFFTIALIWQMAIWVRAILLALVARRAEADGDAGQLATALDIVRLLVTALVFAVAFVAMLDNLGANVTGLIAGLGIGGIAIGLAAQGVVGDLFAALSIIFDRPFARGDSIAFDEVDGSVEAIGLKTTRIRAFTGEEVIISNANLLGKVIRNNTRLAKRRVLFTIGLTYQTPPEAAAGVPGVLRALADGSERVAFVRAGLTGFGASGIDYVFQFDVLSSDYETMVAERHAMAVAIQRRFAELGLEFAYPTSVQFMAGPDGRPIDPRQVFHD